MGQLREIPRVTQLAGEPRRRWFTSSDLDLVVWFDEAGAPRSFQLTYDKRRQERVVTWRPGRGATHMDVDDAPAHAFKSSPLLSDDGALDARDVLARFLADSADLPDDVRALVVGALQAHAD